jgi:hypothetical protein
MVWDFLLRISDENNPAFCVSTKKISEEQMLTQLPKNEPSRLRQKKWND